MYNILKPTNVIFQIVFDVSIFLFNKFVFIRLILSNSYLEKKSARTYRLSKAGKLSILLGQ